MKSKKGFTLIELLAVIVILAIIALIAVPVILNIIEKARSGAAKSSAMSYIKATETYMVISKLDKNKEQLKPGATYTTDKINDLVELKGTKPTGGNVVISDHQSVASAILIINDYTITYNGLDNSYTVGKDDNDISGSGFINNLTLKEMDVVIDFPVETKELDQKVSDVISLCIDAIETKVDTSELEQLKTETYTWISKNDSILKIKDNKVTGIKEGKTELIGTNKKGGKVYIPINVIVGWYLSDKASVGDYVAYDAGIWTETKEKTISSEEFGGYTAGQSKNASVDWCYSATYKTEMKGWRVLKIDTTTKTVTLVHAGQPECYHHGSSGSGSVSKLNTRASSEYLNAIYATSAHNLTNKEASAITENTSATTDDLRYIGVNGTTNNSAHYWLAFNSQVYELYYVSSNGAIGSNGQNKTYGTRPVVELKANIKTTGKGTDEFNQEAWKLIKP